MMVGGYNDNSDYFIGILPDGTKKWYCEERDFKEEYAEMEAALLESREHEGE